MSSTQTSWNPGSSSGGANVLVDQSFLAAYDVSGDGNANAILTLTSDREDTGWSMATNVATYTGSPDKVRISINVYDDGAQSGGLQRIAPGVRLFKNGVEIVVSATGYQRHSNNHSSSSNTISFVDDSPGVNPTYSVFGHQGSSLGNIMLITNGSASFDAIEKVAVLSPPPVPVFTPWLEEFEFLDGAMVSDTGLTPWEVIGTVDFSDILNNELKLGGSLDWTSGIIDTSAVNGSDVTWDYSFSELGGLESLDSVELSYRVDGGVWVTVVQLFDDFTSPHVGSASITSGDDLEIRVHVENNSSGGAGGGAPESILLQYMRVT